MSHTCTGVRGTLLHGARLLRSDSQRPRDAAGRGQCRPGACRAEAAGPPSCTVSRSGPLGALCDSRLRRLPWACSRTDGDQADPRALAAAARQAGHGWRRGFRSSSGQRQRREPCCPGVQLTEPRPDARARLAMDFRLLFRNEDEANNLTICSHKQATCRVDNETPTLTVADEDPFVLSPHGHL